MSTSALKELKMKKIQDDLSKKLAQRVNPNQRRMFDDIRGLKGMNETPKIRNYVAKDGSEYLYNRNLTSPDPDFVFVAQEPIPKMIHS